jgi:hypothetical protein
MKFLLAKRPAKFPERKEGNKSAKYNKGAAEQIVDTYLAGGC